MNDPTATACDCERPVFPVVISNLPGLSRVAYRCGEYVGFRAALLEARDGEVELPLWHPAPGDLGLQLVEWWAYLSDVLTFYNEQWANNAYLGTAFHRGAVERMVQLLGYRPRPGIGAKGTLAAILAPTTSGTVTIPVGFAV